jgi:hypothetical protein
MARKRPLIPNRRHALALGWLGLLVGAVGMYDAYERRGKDRPFAYRFLPL